MVSFQVYDVRLNDRYEKGLDEGDRDKILQEEFMSHVTPKSLDKKPGCVAYIFGRTEDGKSVCSRVEGITPRLYYFMDAKDTVSRITSEISKVVGRFLPKGGHLWSKECLFAHDYGYEPDPESPSGRQVHRYCEVSFPSLRSWRAACKSSKTEEFKRLQKDIQEKQLLVSKAAATLEAHPEDEGRYKKFHGTLKKELDILLKRQTLQKEQWEEWLRDNGGGVDEDVEVGRIAQEWFVQPVTRFMHESGITPSRWYEVPAKFPSTHKVSTCDLEFVNEPDDFKRLDNDMDAPYKKLFYDIETTGLDPETKKVIQVSLVFSSQNAAKKKFIVCLHKMAPFKDGTIRVECDDERGILRAVRKIIVNEDPDFVVSYNGVNFDNHFLNVRAQQGSVEEVEDFYYMSRLMCYKCRCVDLQLASSGMGDNLLRYFDMPGRGNFDWYVILKRTMTSEPSYKLNHFAKKYCGKQKDELASPLTWKTTTVANVGEKGIKLDIVGLGELLQQRTVNCEAVLQQAEWEGFPGHEEDVLETHYVEHGGQFWRPLNYGYKAIEPLQHGSDVDRRRLGAYCVNDSDLLDDLDEALTLTTGILQFAGVFGINPEWVYFRGQQIRFVAQLLDRVRTQESVPLLLNKPPEGFHGEGMDGFEGATVNVPDKGFYNKHPVGTLDWKSLYPSIMMAHNLCHSTWIQHIDAYVEKFGWDGVVKHVIDETMTTYFIHKTKHKGILPSILEDLLAKRSAAKKMVKFHSNEAKKYEPTTPEHKRHKLLSNVFDGRQLALKVACNSVYGACGASVESGGKYPCMAISATVTSEGRQAMVIKKDILPKLFPGCKIVYGDTDSVMIIFEGVEDVEACAELCHKAADEVTKHFEDLDLKPMELEFEKIYFPYLLENKKRYVGLKWEPGSNGKMECKGVDAKGVETEKRDTLPFTKDIMHEVVDSLMYRRDEKEAWNRFDRKMEELINDKVPMDKLILKKNLSGKAEKKSDTIAHAAVNRKRREREAGSEAAVNEQVEYVIVNGHKKSKTTDMAEDPVYAREQGLKLNRLWYFEHAIKEPIGKIFECFPNMDYEYKCKLYSQRLDAARLGMTGNNALSAMLKKRVDGDSSSSTLKAVSHVPRPVAPPPKRKKK